MTELARVHPDEPGAVALLDQAITALTTALDDMPIGEVVHLKAKVATVQTATKELGMSKEAQELATEAVRRAEWALGRALRKGQANGTVATRADNPGPRDEYERNGYTVRPADQGHHETKVSVSDVIAEGGRTRHDILGLADAAPEPADFAAALDAAKAEGNLSRANVARKAREAAGKTPAPADAGTTERAHQEAELINAFGSIVRRSLTPKNVATLTPKARARLISILNDALNALQETSS